MTKKEVKEALIESERSYLARKAGSGEELSDTQLLDRLDQESGSYSGRVIMRESTTGRGWRLHETSQGLCDGASSNVRTAIHRFLVHSMNLAKDDVLYAAMAWAKVVTQPHGTYDSTVGKAEETTLLTALEALREQGWPKQEGTT